MPVRIIIVCKPVILGHDYFVNSFILESMHVICKKIDKILSNVGSRIRGYPLLGCIRVLNIQMDDGCSPIGKGGNSYLKIGSNTSSRKDPYNIEAVVWNALVA